MSIVRKKRLNFQLFQYVGHMKEGFGGILNLAFIFSCNISTFYRTRFVSVTVGYSDEGNQTNDRTLELHSKNSRHFSAACDKLRPAVITDILCSSGECKLAQSGKRLEKNKL